MTGFTWAGGDAGGTIPVGDGFESTADAMWNFGFAIARVAGLVIFGIGQALLFAYATVAWFLEPDRGSVLAADPVLDAGGQEVNEELAVDPDS